MGPTLRFAALIVALAITAASCSSGSRLDREGLEAEVLAQLFPQYPDLVTDLSCPELDDPVPGRSFVCAAQLGRQIIDFEVVLGGTAESLQASVVLDDRFVAAQQIADMLASTLAAEVGIATIVDCGQPIVVLEPGSVLECSATDPTGVVRIFDVDIDDDGELGLTIR